VTADAMTGLATGLKQNRKQDILTPQVIVDFLTALWGETELDPCATRDPRDLVNARHRVFEPGESDGNGGLDVPWPDRTYANPPYGDLECWLRKAAREALTLDSLAWPRVVVLAPTRGHRDWWHEVRDTCDVVVELRPVYFVGYPGSFPAPLSLLCWNVIEESVRAALQVSGLRYTKISVPGESA
jgi:hypothetical protein